MTMKTLMLAATAALALTWAAPAAAQDFPLKSGNFWSVSEITIDDGHFGDYADFLAGQWRKNQEFSKSKGWTKDSYILANNNKRAGEPDLYLVTISDHVPTPAEDISREKEFNAFMATNARKEDANSGGRAKFRHLGGTMLLQELTFKR
jgi:opacity protein-like surface antigen